MNVVLNADEITPYLYDGIQFSGKTDKRNVVSFDFYHPTKNLYITVVISIWKRHIFIDYKHDSYDLFNFDYVENSSRLCLLIERALKQSASFRLRFLTGGLECKFSYRVITDFLLYEKRCSYAELDRFKHRILDFFQLVSTYNPNTFHSNSGLSICVSGRDGYVLANFLEELSIANCYPEKNGCYFVIEFHPSLIQPFYKERIILIFQYIEQLGYTVFLR